MTNQPYADITMPLLLLADDHDEIRYLLKRTMQQSNFRVVEAVNGKEALELYQQLKPDIVLLDIMMPVIHGLDVCQQIRALPDGDHVPILIMTALDNIETIARAFEVGATDYLPKPLRPDILRHRLGFLSRTLQAEKALRDSEARSRDILENAYDLIQIVGADGRFQYANRRWLEVLGYTIEEAKNLQFAQIVHPDQRDVLEAAGRDLQSGKEVVEVQLTFVSKQGETLQVEGNMNPKIIEGHFMSARGIFRDVTAKRQTEEALFVYAGELKDRNEGLQHYNQTIAYNLKKPLQALHEQAQYVAKHKNQVPPTLRDALENIHYTSEQLALVIDQMLQLATLDDPNTQLVPVNMQEVFELALDHFQPALEENKISVNVSNALHPVKGHPLWLEQVVYHLLDNAIKFMGEDSPTRQIDISCQRQNMLTRFEIHDTGIGISSQAQHSIFQIFTRLNDSQDGGMGFGLYMVERIISRLNGKLGVDSLPGQGSIFWFSLPAPTIKSLQTGELRPI